MKRRNKIDVPRPLPRFAQLADRLNTSVHWEDLALLKSERKHLHEIVSRMKHKTELAESLGHTARVSPGGVTAMFTGPGDSDKTMAAAVLANDLKLELYKVDLSRVVSKYIGETEKNLDRIFAEAEGANVVLFFDEADVLFGNRTEVKDSHDRYADTEVAYLLQRMEAYQGLVILATNLMSGLDEAFNRCFDCVMEFPKK